MNVYVLIKKNVKCTLEIYHVIMHKYETQKESEKCQVIGQFEALIRRGTNGSRAL